MSDFCWNTFLAQFSRELLADRDLRKQLPAAVVQSGWLGFEPATVAEITELESRLGTTLPDSYKRFFAASNGWRDSGSFIYEVFPTAQVAWFRDLNQDWIDAYVEPSEGMPQVSLEDHCNYGPTQNCCNFRVEYLQSALQISAEGDSAVYLLNPEIQTPDGEWEAWFFANWNPGANRYRSFRKMMEQELSSFVQLRDHRERRYFPEDGVETLPSKLPGLFHDLAEKSQFYSQANAQNTAMEDYASGTIAALREAETMGKEVQDLDLPAEELLTRLTEIADYLQRQWQAKFRDLDPGQKGQAEGYRQASGVYRWFLNLK